MLRISKLTDYGVMVMAFFAKHPQQSYSAKEIAQATKIALPTVSKLLKILARSSLLLAQRGANGGYSLAVLAKNISLAQIINALEGNIGLTECSHGQGLCSMEPQCLIRHNWRTINTAIIDTLHEIKLAQMILPMQAKTIKENVINKLHSNKQTALVEM